MRQEYTKWFAMSTILSENVVSTLPSGVALISSLTLSSPLIIMGVGANLYISLRQSPGKPLCDRGHSDPETLFGIRYIPAMSTTLQREIRIEDVFIPEGQRRANELCSDDCNARQVEQKHEEQQPDGLLPQRRRWSPGRLAEADGNVFRHIQFRGDGGGRVVGLVRGRRS